jgi:acetyltransferase-like isoleucine patch superfamily enzyme
LLSNPKFIHIGKNVFIRQGARIEVVLDNIKRTPELRIGDNVNIEQNVHIVCHSRIIIGSNVSITGHCAIIDVTHPYLDMDDPMKIGARILDDDSFVEIGDGSFIGFGAVIMPNVCIGRCCIVGAHSVVTKDVPDYSAVSGSPARVLRQYNVQTKEWHASQ